MKRLTKLGAVAKSFKAGASSVAKNIVFGAPELDVDDDIIPTLTDTEKAALLAARKGEHQTLTERHYTIGGSVRRAP